MQFRLRFRLLTFLISFFSSSDERQSTNSFNFLDRFKGIEGFAGVKSLFRMYSIGESERPSESLNVLQ